MPRTLERPQLRTVQLVPLTPFDHQGQLALSPLRRLIARVFEAGVRVFIPCAGSAEFHTLTEEEIVTSISVVREEVGDEGVVVAPIGHRWEQALQLGKKCQDAGADAALVMPLAFPYLADAGARDYYRALLDQLDCPVLIYKKAEVPSDELLLELADHPQLWGVKYAVNDVDAFNRVVQRDEGRIDWFCGSAERFAPFFALAGATGYTSGAGNLCPALTLAMHAALAGNDWRRAMELQHKILPIEQYRARAGNSYNISFLKYAISLTGLDFGPPRPPQRRLTEEDMHEIDALMPDILAAEHEVADAVHFSAVNEACHEPTGK